MNAPLATAAVASAHAPATTNSSNGAPESHGPGSTIATEFASKTHANLQDMVKVADAKAGSLVAVQTLMLALIAGDLGARLVSAWSNNDLLGWVVRLGSIGAFFGFGASIVLALLVLAPRFPKFLTRPTGARGLMWIDDILKHEKNPNAYVDQIAQTTERQQSDDLAFENLKVSWLLRRKFRFLKLAVWALIVAVAALLATLATGFMVARSNAQTIPPTAATAAPSPTGATPP